ncbi:hypothetical protein [Acetobacterium wieringae]|uniref:hypothetical protein n=1 Tax=Acetobacterium wieringae TaxID=52694 RepID=UPI002B1F77CC|nr:hypothetical protein [Acetobacterium wieringae]MEA4804770.1 hypothetical protein [Acetobacterium wieringae]
MSLNVKTPILSLVLTLFLVIVLAPTTATAKNESPPTNTPVTSSIGDEPVNASQLVNVDAFHAEYRGHIQNIGDIEAWTIGPDQFGTVGRSLRIEGFMIQLTGDVPADMHIKYTVHVQNHAWLYPVDDDSTWPTDGAFAGTRGESLRLEAVHIKLVDDTGNLYPGYSVYYRGHVENEGDIDWVKNNGELGSTGKSQRLEALEIKIVKDVPDIPEVPAPDLTAYLAAIAAYQDKTDLYTTDSWSLYQTVLSAHVMSAKNSQIEVDTATQLIIDAQKQLVLKSSGGGSGGGGGWTPPVPTPTLSKKVDVITESNGSEIIDLITPAIPTAGPVIQMPACRLFSVSNLQELLGTMGTKKLHKASLTANNNADDYHLTNVLFGCNHPELVLNDKNASGQFIAPDGLIRLSALTDNLKFTFYRTDVTVSDVITGIEKNYPGINMQNNEIRIQIDLKTIAEKSVEKTESTKLPDDLTTAKGWVDQLPEGDDKTSLYTRINEVAKANLKATTFEKLVIPENTEAAKLAAVTAQIKSLIGSISYELTPNGNDYRIKLAPSNAPAELTLTTTFLQTVNQPAIGGVTVPALEDTPVTGTSETDQYSGRISWQDQDAGIPTQYEDGKKYTATITLTPKAVSDGSNLVGYTLTGVPENYFTVVGTETPATNPATSGVVTAFFPTVVDPVEIAVKAAETSRDFRDVFSARGLVDQIDPTGGSLRKQRFQARLDLLMVEIPLVQLSSAIRGNRMIDDNYSWIDSWLGPASASVAALPDGSLKTSLGDRLAVSKTVFGLITVEYQNDAFSTPIELLVADDAHKLAAVKERVSNIVKNDGNDCQEVTVTGTPWKSGNGGNMTFDTYDITVTKGSARMDYSILIGGFLTPDFEVKLDNEDGKSADTPFELLITGFQDEQGSLLNGSRKVNYFCWGNDPFDTTPTLLVEQTLTFTNGAATLPVTLPASTDTFEFASWNKYLFVRVEYSNREPWLVIPVASR